MQGCRLSFYFRQRILLCRFRSFFPETKGNSIIPSILPRKQFRAEHFPEKVPCLIKTKALRLAPELFAAIVRTRYAVAVTEVDIMREMLGIKIFILLFGVRIIGFTATVKDDLYQFDGALHLIRVNRTVSEHRPLAHVFRHHLQFHLNDRQQVIPAPVLVEGGSPPHNQRLFPLFLSLLNIFTGQTAVSPDVRAIFSFTAIFRLDVILGHGDLFPHSPMK